mgnify:CR=1 FL=1
MKLVLAIINPDDPSAVMKNLSKQGFYFTRLSTSGSLLKSGNVTLISAVEDDKLDDLINIYREFSRKRTQTVTPYADFSDLFTAGNPVEINVGGATIMVVEISRFEKL